MDEITIRVRRVRGDRDSDIPLPQYMTPDSAGADLCAALDSNLTLKPLERSLVPTGIAVSIPPGYEAQIRPRSGLAIKHGITLLNTPGTVDSDFRGEIRIIVANLSSEPYTIRRGDRIAQMVIGAVARARFDLVETLEDTHRGDGGFGHTGT